MTALPSIPRERWTRWVLAADVLLVDGGDATYLAHWIRAGGLGDLLVEQAGAFAETVWVGVSAGSMVLTPRIGPQFVAWEDAPDDGALGVVGFSIFPHLDYPGWPGNTRERARQWAADIAGPAYAIDDATALVVEAGRERVVSEGFWEYLG